MARLWTLGIVLLVCILERSNAGEPCSDLKYCIHPSQCPETQQIIYRSIDTVFCNDFQVCCKIEEKEDEDKKPSKDYSQCGVSNSEGLGFLLQTSEEARPGEFPWTVAFFNKEQYFAAGSLLAPGIVLSAYHIMNEVNLEDLRIRAGDWDLNSTREIFKPQERSVARIESHEDFRIKTGSSNLALYFLETPFDLADHIRTICLPESDTSFEGKECLMSGWGKKNFTDENFSTVLKVADLPLVNFTDCQSRLRTTVLGNTFHLPKSLLCAGGEENEDACTGDGGSSLFCPMTEDPSRYVQVGIVNWGNGCGKKGIPGVYTDVLYLRDWIRQKMTSVPEVSPPTRSESPRLMGNYRK